MDDLTTQRETLVKQHGELEAKITELVTLRERTIGAIMQIDAQLKAAGPQAVPPLSRAERRRAAKTARA